MISGISALSFWWDISRHFFTYLFFVHFFSQLGNEMCDKL